MSKFTLKWTEQKSYYLQYTIQQYKNEMKKRNLIGWQPHIIKIH